MSHISGAQLPGEGKGMRKGPRCFRRWLRFYLTVLAAGEIRDSTAIAEVVPTPLVIAPYAWSAGLVTALRSTPTGDDRDSAVRRPIDTRVQTAPSEAHPRMALEIDVLYRQKRCVELWVADLSGRNVRFVCRESGVTLTSVRWSPDNTRVAYTVVPLPGHSNEGPLMLADVANGNKTEIAATGAAAGWERKTDDLIFSETRPAANEPFRRWRAYRLNLRGITAQGSPVAFGDLSGTCCGVYNEATERLVMADDGVIRILDTRMGDRMDIPTSIHGKTTNLTISEDGRWICSIGQQMRFPIDAYNTETCLIDTGSGRVLDLTEALNAANETIQNAGLVSRPAGKAGPYAPVGATVCEWLPGPEHRLMVWIEPADFDPVPDPPASPRRFTEVCFSPDRDRWQPAIQRDSDATIVPPKTEPAGSAALNCKLGEGFYTIYGLH